jgi:hypothetical protein
MEAMTSSHAIAALHKTAATAEGGNFGEICA